MSTQISVSVALEGLRKLSQAQINANRQAQLLQAQQQGQAQKSVDAQSQAQAAEGRNLRGQLLYGIKSDRQNPQPQAVGVYRTDAGIPIANGWERYTYDAGPPETETVRLLSGDGTAFVEDVYEYIEYYTAYNNTTGSVSNPIGDIGPVTDGEEFEVNSTFANVTSTIDTYTRYSRYNRLQTNVANVIDHSYYFQAYLPVGPQTYITVLKRKEWSAQAYVTRTFETTLTYDYVSQRVVTDPDGDYVKIKFRAVHPVTTSYPAPSVRTRESSLQYAALVSKSSVRFVPFPAALDAAISRGICQEPSYSTPSFTASGGSNPTAGTITGFSLVLLNPAEDSLPIVFSRGYGILDNSAGPTYPTYGTSYSISQYTAAIYKLLRDVVSNTAIAYMSTPAEWRPYFASEPFGTTFLAKEALPDQTAGIARYDIIKNPPDSGTATGFIKNAKGAVSMSLYATALPVVVWDWGQPAYCQAQLLLLGFTSGDLTP